MSSEPVMRLVRALAIVALVATACQPNPQPPADTSASGVTADSAQAGGDLSAGNLTEGQRVFRFDTFGDEQFWTDTARMHEVVQKSVSPTTALSVGLKVDADAIPPDVAAAIKAGKVDLKDPATTVTLLKLNAVVGLKGDCEHGQWEGHAVAARHHLRVVSLDCRQFILEGNRPSAGRLAES